MEIRSVFTRLLAASSAAMLFAAVASMTACQLPELDCNTQNDTITVNDVRYVIEGCNNLQEIPPDTVPQDSPA